MFIIFVIDVLFLQTFTMTSMLVLLIVGLKCKLAASHDGEYAYGTDRRTDGRTPDRYITLFAERGYRKNVGGKSHFHFDVHSGGTIAPLLSLTLFRHF